MTSLTIIDYACHSVHPTIVLAHDDHSCHNGAWGLLALQEAEQVRTALPFSFLGDWQNQIDRLLRQEEAKHHLIVTPIIIPVDEAQNELECDMSMRPNVDKAAIESFLQQLGRTFRKPGRLYLVGGAALVHAGVRPGFTQDIVVQVSGSNEGELIVAIQHLIQQTQVNVEFASPVDFIPLPSQWEAHAGVSVSKPENCTLRTGISSQDIGEMTGEPCNGKLFRTVRRGTDGKGSAKIPRQPSTLQR